jgi:exopolysaccharide production protein ExoQ
MEFFLGLQLQIALFLSMASIGLDGGSGGDGSSGSRQLFYGATAIISIGYLVINALAGRDRPFSVGGWPLTAILLYVCSSAFWSIGPAVTAKRAVLMAILLLVCGVSVGMWAKNWREDIFSRLLAKPMGLLLVLSLLLTIMAPGRAFSDIGWRGIANHKNEAGQMMAFATVLLLYGVCHDRMGKKLRAALVAIVLVGLLMAKSTTALLGLVVGVGVTEMIMLRSTIYRLGSWQIAVAGVLLITSCIVFFAYQLDLLPSSAVIYSKIFEVLGKSETFTGRTAIWEIVLGESRFHNPLIGGGYGAFWVGRESISGYVLMGDNLYPGQSHNGYVDIYNDLGLIGAGLLAVIIVIALSNAVRVSKLNHPEAKLHLAIVLLCAFLNLGESTFFRTTVFMNIVFLASFIRAAAILRHARYQERDDEFVGAQDLVSLRSAP